jgi:hypothetical protein
MHDVDTLSSNTLTSVFKGGSNFEGLTSTWPQSRRSRGGPWRFFVNIFFSVASGDETTKISPICQICFEIRANHKFIAWDSMTSSSYVQRRGGARNWTESGRKNKLRILFWQKSKCIQRKRYKPIQFAYFHQLQLQTTIYSKNIQNRATFW